MTIPKSKKGDNVEFWMWLLVAITTLLFVVTIPLILKCDALQANEANLQAFEGGRQK